MGSQRRKDPAVGRVDKPRLIELMGGATAQFSLQGRMAREYDFMEQIFDLAAPEQFVTSQLAELVGGLRRPEKAEEQE